MVDDGFWTHDTRSHNPVLYHWATPTMRPAGLEPATYDLEGRCSFLLSYGRYNGYGYGYSNNITYITNCAAHILHSLTIYKIYVYETNQFLHYCILTPIYLNKLVYAFCLPFVVSYLLFSALLFFIFYIFETLCCMFLFFMLKLLLYIYISMLLCKMFSVIYWY